MLYVPVFGTVTFRFGLRVVCAVCSPIHSVCEGGEERQSDGLTVCCRLIFYNAEDLFHLKHSGPGLVGSAHLTRTSSGPERWIT